ncbi:MAG TPA: hypothetical protein VGR55_09880 [Candidatus Acidoferrum sp.]|nr:hypothetical protein [Candidatus Acidoferrum sp.]
MVVCALKKGAFRNYLLLNVYMLASVAVTVARFNVLRTYGLASTEYIYVYYYSDALLTIFLYFALGSLYAHVLGELKAERYLRFATLLLLAGTALFSYAVVQQSTTRLITRFVVELSQNLYFVGLVLTYILWGAILKMRETRMRLIQLVLSLGVYFSLFAADYALRNLYPSTRSVLGSLQQVIACFLPLAWAFAFWFSPEEARIAPARVAAVTR